MKQIAPDITMTTELCGDFQGGFLPTLDCEIRMAVTEIGVRWFLRQRTISTENQPFQTWC